MTILNFPDLLDPDKRKDKRKNNKRKIQQMTARFWCILRPLITPADERRDPKPPWEARIRFSTIPQTFSTAMIFACG